MLSIGKIALGQHRYYEQQVAQGADDYYSGRGEAPGEWVGDGAQALGLAGRVSGQQFSALLAGGHPRDPARRLRSSERDPKIAAFDLTFSAPKSISVLFATAPEQVSGVLVASHEDAVRAALGYLEDVAVMVRRGRGGERSEHGEGLIAAAYRHRMSRALDPQLHTHVVAANLARGPDGRFTSLHSSLLYKTAKTAGTLYQAHLRALVTERLGLQWGEVHKGAAELSDVRRGVLEHFSERRHEMRRAAEADGIGLGSKRAAEAAALATRERKQYGLQTHTWREEVRARAGERGLDGQEIDGLLRAGAQRVAAGLARRGGVDERALGELLVGAEGLTERANTFDERPVLQEFAAAARDGALVGEIRGQAQRFTERADVIPTAYGEMTSAQLIECERSLIGAAVGRQGKDSVTVGTDLVEHTIQTADRPLTDQQARAVRATLASRDGVTVIQALAGTGKTYTAGVLRAGYEQAGYRVLGAAPTGRAARELSEDAGIPARTLDRMLLDIEQLGDELPEHAVVILDEAGMAPTRLSARLLAAAEQAGAKVVAIGDPGQLSSVQAGGWLAVVGSQLGALRLTQVIRQRDPAERAALAVLHDHQPQRYLQWAQSQGRIQTFNDPTSAQDRALAQWREATLAFGPQQAVMIARDNDLRATLNELARETQKQRGVLGVQRSYATIELAVGDRVICRQNDRLIDVDNGTRGTVASVAADRVVIQTDAGTPRELPAGYVSEHVEHAYALTGHGMQGGTVERAIVIAAAHELTAGWSYTALSRARDQTRLLVYDERRSRERSEFAPNDAPANTTRAQLLVQVARRMLQRDDEDLAVDQLPAGGRADDPALQAARGQAGVLAQEHAAGRAEPSVTAAASTERLRQLRQLIDGLCQQRDRLPTRGVQRIEDLDARVRTLSQQRAQLTARLAKLPEPRRRLGRERDPHAVERTHLAGAIQASDRQLDVTLQQRERLARELGDPGEIRAERDALQRAIAAHTREHTAIGDQLAERELDKPAAWATRTFGQRPSEGPSRDTWDQGVLRATRYRLRYELTSEDDPLGPQPEDREQQRDWQRAHEAIERSTRRLGRENEITRDTAPEIER